MTDQAWQTFEGFTQQLKSRTLYRFSRGTRRDHLQSREKEWLNGKGILDEVDR